jgi:DNA-binding MarR family transcriptional regulator
MTSQVLTTQVSGQPLEAWIRLLRASAAMRRELNAGLDGLAVSDFEALLQLSHAEGGGMRRVDLAEGLGLTASGVTRLLEGLESAGLVDRHQCARDGRVTYAVITEAGRAKLAEASWSHLRAIRALFEERFEPEELDALVSLLGRLPGASSCDTNTRTSSFTAE